MIQHPERLIVIYLVEGSINRESEGVREITHSIDYLLEESSAFMVFFNLKAVRVTLLVADLGSVDFDSHVPSSA